MSTSLIELFDKNRAWAEDMKGTQPDFFRQQSTGQAPKYLWIGCSDSRVSPTQMMRLGPGNMFVHRNIANLVIPTDLNVQAVIQYAIEALKVEHVIICGHTGCGGLRAVLEKKEMRMVSQWLQPLAQIRDRRRMELDKCASDDERLKCLGDWNVREQVKNICEAQAILAAWKRGQPLAIHGWVYSLDNGLLNDLLKTPVTSPQGTETL